MSNRITHPVHRFTVSVAWIMAFLFLCALVATAFLIPDSPSQHYRLFLFLALIGASLVVRGDHFDLGGYLLLFVAALFTAIQFFGITIF